MHTTSRPSRATTAIPLIAVLLLALNLRPLVTSVGPVLRDISRDLSFTDTTAGFLTALPTLCFAAVGALAPALGRRFGQQQVVAVAILLLLAGQLGRAWTSQPGLFLSFTAMALSAMALGNVLLPGLVRRYFPHCVARVTAWYSMVIVTGTALASVVTAPLALRFGGWRGAFVALSTLTVALLVAWLPMLRHRTAASQTERNTYSLMHVAKTSRGIGMALFFGLQSAFAYFVFGWLPTIYVDAGLTPVRAGLMLGIVTGVGIPLAFLVPHWVAKSARPHLLALGLNLFLAAGYVGLIVAPATLPWLWALLLSVGLSTFPLFLSLVATRASTPAGTASLSGFSQAVGYLIGFIATWAFGAAHEFFHSWTVVLSGQFVFIIPLTWLSMWLCQEWNIEDIVNNSGRKGPTNGRA